MPWPSRVRIPSGSQNAENQLFILIFCLFFKENATQLRQPLLLITSVFSNKKKCPKVKIPKIQAH